MTKRYLKKKHRGVKDPYDVQRRKDLAKKPNRRPEDPNRQEVPRRLRQLSKYFIKEDSSTSVKEKKNKKKKKNMKSDENNEKSEHKTTSFGEKVQSQKKSPRKSAGGKKLLTIKGSDDFSDMGGMTRPEKRIPDFVQLEGETERQFMQRVYRETERIQKEMEFEEKYGYQVETDEQGKSKIVGLSIGTKMGIKLEKQKEKRSEKAKEQRKKWKEKEKALVEKKMEKKYDEFYQKDTFVFGERVDAPPKLETGKLEKKINENGTKEKKFLFMNKVKKEKKPQRKDVVNVTLAHKRFLEEEREKVLQTYRDMKAAKRHKVTIFSEIDKEDA